jgi:hypothetical protein
VTRREERRVFLERSLADLEEEHDAGDLSDGDYTRLKADYERRLAVLEGRARPAPAPAPPPRRPLVTAGMVVGVAAFAVLAGVLMAQSAGRRGAGDNISGADVNDTGASTAGAGTTVPDALGRCFDLQGSDASDCYIAYTRAHPDDPDGFVYFGLFAVNQGLANDSPELLSGGETFLRRALEIDPGHLAARANLAVLLERTDRDEEARDELAALEGVELPADVQQLVDFVRANLAPSGSGAGSTTTAP